MKRENIILGLSALAPFLLGGQAGGVNKSKPIKLSEFKKEIPYCSTDKFYLFDDQIVKIDKDDKITYYFQKPSAKFKNLIEALTFEDASIKPFDVEEAYAWHRLKPKTHYMKNANYWSVSFDADLSTGEGEEPILLGTDGVQAVIEGDLSLVGRGDEVLHEGMAITTVSQKLPATGGYIKQEKGRIHLFLPSIGKAISIKVDQGSRIYVDRVRGNGFDIGLKEFISIFTKMNEIACGSDQLICTLKRIKNSYEIEKKSGRSTSDEIVELITDENQTVLFNSKFIPDFKDITAIYKQIGIKDMEKAGLLFVTDYSSHLVMPLRRPFTKKPAVKEQVIDEKNFGKKTKGSKNDGITVVRVEKRRSRYGDKHHMRAMSRGRMFTPEVVGATVTLEGADPQALRTYQHVEGILRDEERKLGLFGSMLVFRNVYQSHKQPNMWEAQWDIS